MATKTHDTTAIRELNTIVHRYPAKNDTSLNDLYLQRKWLSYFGGAVRGHCDYSYIFSRIKPGDPLFNEEQVEAGEAFSMRTLWKQLLNIDFFTTAPVLKVPVYFVTGRYDYNTPFALVEKYYNQVKAPAKKLIWFENSAHIPQFEEALKFNAMMKEIAQR
jgi:pimeloyl-ACP methyl ester carboxylesterase